jgi:hypothetical protein
VIKATHHPLCPREQAAVRLLQAAGRTPGPLRRTESLLVAGGFEPRNGKPVASRRDDYNSVVPAYTFLKASFVIFHASSLFASIHRGLNPYSVQ